MPSPGTNLRDEVGQHAAAFGLNLTGVVPRGEFDDCQPPGRRLGELMPDCGSAVVIGSGGREFWEKTCQTGARPRIGDSRALRARAIEAVEAVADCLSRAGWPARCCYPDERPLLNFMQLGEMAGLGTVSPVVGLLIHPEFGPWVRFRGAVLVAGNPFGEQERAVPPTFQPCLTCKRPCIDACPANVYRSGAPSFEHCAQHRHRGGCQIGCDVRRACPVGNGHGYCFEEEIAGHTECLDTMRRHYGLGTWKIVPRPLRRR